MNKVSLLDKFKEEERMNSERREKKKRDKMLKLIKITEGS